MQRQGLSPHLKRGAHAPWPPRAAQASWETPSLSPACLRAFSRGKPRRRSELQVGDEVPRKAPFPQEGAWPVPATARLDTPRSHKGTVCKAGVRLRGTAGNAQAPRPKAAGSHWPLGLEGRGEGTVTRGWPEPVSLSHFHRAPAVRNGLTSEPPVLPSLAQWHPRTQSRVESGSRVQTKAVQPDASPLPPPVAEPTGSALPRLPCS